MRIALCILAWLSLFQPSHAQALRPIIVVGNNWDGTATIVDAQTYQVLRKLNLIPDKAERFKEIEDEGIKRRFMAWFIRNRIGQGHDQFVDDMFPSHDGRYIYASRPSFADVVAYDLATDKIAWRTRIAGDRADHAALSPDGKTFLVSASTARKVQAINTADGKIIAEFESGDQPHENNYSADGKRIYHASIGKVFVSSPKLDKFKGDRWFEVVDAQTWKVSKRIDLGQMP